MLFPHGTNLSALCRICETLMAALTGGLTFEAEDVFSLAFHHVDFIGFVGQKRLLQGLR